MITKVPPNFAVDGGCSEMAKRCAAIRIKSVDRLDQAETADLYQISEWLAPSDIPTSQGVDEGEVFSDQGLAGMQSSRVMRRLRKEGTPLALRARLRHGW
jgi:hypothetical protein